MVTFCDLQKDSNTQKKTKQNKIKGVISDFRGPSEEEETKLTGL